MWQDRAIDRATHTHTYIGTPLSLLKSEHANPVLNPRSSSIGEFRSVHRDRGGRAVSLGSLLYAHIVFNISTTVFRALWTSSSAPGDAGFAQVWGGWGGAQIAPIVLHVRIHSAEQDVIAPRRGESRWIKRSRRVLATRLLRTWFTPKQSDDFAGGSTRNPT